MRRVPALFVVVLTCSFVHADVIYRDFLNGDTTGVPNTIQPYFVPSRLIAESGLMLDITPQAGAASDSSSVSVISDVRTTEDGSCAVEYADQLDFNGDCIVDFEDFAILASSWLSCGIYPDC